MTKPKALALQGGKIVEKKITKPKDALPCPWCNTKPEMQPWHGGGPNKHLIGCASVNCEVSPSVSGESPEEAIRKWNRRKGERSKA